jgi:hypothetical protein
MSDSPVVLLGYSLANQNSAEWISLSIMGWKLATYALEECYLLALERIESVGRYKARSWTRSRSLNWTGRVLAFIALKRVDVSRKAADWYAKYEGVDSKGQHDCSSGLYCLQRRAVLERRD